MLKQLITCATNILWCTTKLATQQLELSHAKHHVEYLENFLDHQER